MDIYHLQRLQPGSKIRARKQDGTECDLVLDSNGLWVAKGEDYQLYHPQALLGVFDSSIRVISTPATSVEVGQRIDYLEQARTLPPGVLLRALKRDRLQFMLSKHVPGHGIVYETMGQRGRRPLRPGDLPAEVVWTANP